MTSAQSAPDRENPLLADWTAPSACRPSRRLHLSSPPRVRPGRLPATAPKSTPLRQTLRRRPLPTPSKRWSAAGARSIASPASFSCWRGPIPVMPRGDRARYLAAARPPQQRALSQPRALCRIAELYRRRAELGLNAEQRACSIATTPSSCAPARRSAGRARSSRDNQRAGWQPRHPVRAERAGGREGLRPGARG